MLFFATLLQQFTRNKLWEKSAGDFRGIIFKLLAVVFAFGFYLPSFYSLGREAWDLSNSLQVLKPIVYYNVIAALAFKLLEPLQRCDIGSYTGRTGAPASCRDRNETTTTAQGVTTTTRAGRWGPFSKFTDTIISNMLAIISSTMLFPTSNGIGSQYGYTDSTDAAAGFYTVGRETEKDASKAPTAPVVNINFLETVFDKFNKNPLILAAFLGLFLGLIHRALMTPRDVIGGPASAEL